MVKLPVNFKRPLAILPSQAKSIFRLGEVSLAQEKYGEARELFQPKFAGRLSACGELFQLGLIELYGFRNKELTITNWERFLQVRPNDRQADKIRAAINILKQQSFTIPPESSNIPMDEILLMGAVQYCPRIFRLSRQGEMLNQSEQRKNQQNYFQILVYS